MQGEVFARDCAVHACHTIYPTEHGVCACAVEQTSGQHAGVSSPHKTAEGPFALVGWLAGPDRLLRWHLLCWQDHREVSRACVGSERF